MLKLNYAIIYTALLIASLVTIGCGKQKADTKNNSTAQKIESPEIKLPVEFEAQIVCVRNDDDSVITDKFILEFTILEDGYHANTSGLFKTKGPLPTSKKGQLGIIGITKDASAIKKTYPIEYNWDLRKHQNKLLVKHLYQHLHVFGDEEHQHHDGQDEQEFEQHNINHDVIDPYFNTIQCEN